ncbi:hypothetical protein, partial [Staphylococcus aureus]|uniref:hypothetical protein n=1 Tax=Staphylococcus aureus TaxID=1280 RepID=UPI0038B3A5A0
KELAEIKSLCHNVFTMVSNYACAKPPPPSGFPGELKPLDLMSGKRFSGDGETSPKLFGVEIGVKRAREAGGEQEPSDLRLQQPND